jgi:hypothetical protein
VSPVPQLRRYYEGATTSRACIPGPLWFRFQAPQVPSDSCSPKRSRGGEGPPSGLGLGSAGCPCSGVAPVDACGSSQVSWRSIPCLRPGQRPRPGRQDLAPLAVLPMLSPALPDRRPLLDLISRLPHGFGIRCLRFTNDVAVAHARLASGWRAAPLPGGRRTLWIALKGFRFYMPYPFPGLGLTQGRSRMRRSTP